MKTIKVKFSLAILIAILFSGCITVKADKRVHVVKYTFKKKGVTYQVTEDYSRIVTIDTLK
jgi:hypothetical protein